MSVNVSGYQIQDGFIKFSHVFTYFHFYFLNLILHIFMNVQHKMKPNFPI